MFSLTLFFPILCGWVCLWYVLILFFYFFCSCFCSFCCWNLEWQCCCCFSGRFFIFPGGLAAVFPRCPSIGPNIAKTSRKHSGDFGRGSSYQTLAAKFAYHPQLSMISSCNQKKINVNSPAIFIFWRKKQAYLQLAPENRYQLLYL